MPSKPGAKKSGDIKMLMAALAVTTTLGLWNLFSILDKPAATEEIVSLQDPLPVEGASSAPSTFRGKILLGGQAPSTQIIVVQRPKNSQGPAPVTQTRSS